MGNLSSWRLQEAYATCSVLGHAVQMEVKEVFYAYATREGTPALRGVSLTMEPGKLLALVGLSGSGKSTLVALLERLYDPDEGQVKASYFPQPRPAVKSTHRALRVIRSPDSDSCGQFVDVRTGSGCQRRCLLQADAR